MKKLAVLLGLAIVAAVVATSVLVFSGPATTKAAKPTVTTTHLEFHGGPCELTTHLVWNGTKFAHKLGRMTIAYRTVGAGGGSAIVDIPKGTVADDLLQPWGGLAIVSGKTYDTTIGFFTTKGKDGAVQGRLVSADQTAEKTCP